jgi:hypothetical protein
MGKKIELEGYLYITLNEYDQHEVEELCLDNDPNVFFENLSYKIDKNSYTYRWPPEVKSSTYLSSIIQDRLGIKPGRLERDSSKSEQWIDRSTYTFNPDKKKVRITIEELED